ncbi:hypothetical protein ACFO1B_43710 [Dactylosporangium siamense]|uniref:Uncharacterized protein n=1 Tax=Dactylosporangium siamense TaxID=685454 RepID=A0A919PYS4_9ACTN|nr:hypothetical protein [Dactylosporangium siamense]GIG52882.1 hypothetical protein Dsi01nite_109230 [Dactylosporangium siamense]
MLTLRAPTRVLDNVDAVRAPAAAVGATLYSLRAGQLVHVDPAQSPVQNLVRDRGTGWMCQPLGSGHGRGCRLVLHDVDLATALAPVRLTSDGHPDPDRDPAAYLAAWRSRVWRHSAHFGPVADQLAAAATRPVPGSGGAPIAFTDRDSLRRYALGAHRHTVGLQTSLVKLGHSGLVTATTVEGTAAVALTLGLQLHRPAAQAVDLVASVSRS